MNTIGRELKEKYINNMKSKLGPKKISEYNEKINKLIKLFAESIQNKIDNGNYPIVDIPLNIEEYKKDLQDQFFHMLLQEEAEKNDIILEFKIIYDEESKSNIPIMISTVK